jgi:exosome complex component RRP43
MSDNLEAKAFQRLYPDQYFERFLRDGLRLDGRALNVSRAVTVAVQTNPSADASAVIKVGGTSIMAGVRLEVMIPKETAPEDGSVVVNVEMTSLSYPDYRPGKQTATVHTITQALNDLFLRNKVFDTKQLCISPGQAVWVAYLDLYILDACGSLMDACLLAAVAALLSTTLPAVHVTDEGNVERDSTEGPSAGAALAPQGTPLALSCTPTALTCGVYGQHLIPDPDHEEEALMDATITTIINEHGQLLGETLWAPAPSSVIVH